MERTKYFNHTRPTQTQLNYTESSRVNAIQRRFRAGHQMGISKGFIVTVNSNDSTKIDVSAGEAYTGGLYSNYDVKGFLSGERISTLTSTGSGDDIIASLPTVIGQSLSDYTNGVNNYINLIYSETEDTNLAERYYPFTQHATMVRESFSISVLSETDWNNLSYSDLQNRVLIAIVNANGIGVALTNADITQVTQPKLHPVVIQPVNITGCTITFVSGNSPIGVGQLRYVASSKQVFWTAPGDLEGAAVTVASSGEVFVYSSNTDYYIKLTVVFAALPASDVTESITVNSLYGRDIPLFSAYDSNHRDMIGSGQPTPQNPHGMTLGDLGEGTLAHADHYHVNGISIDADSAQLACSIYDPGSTDEIRVNNLGGYENAFLIDGNTYETIDGYTPPAVGILSFDTLPLPSSGDYLIYLDSKGALNKVAIGSGGTSDAYSLWNANIHIIDIKNQLAGSGYIRWDSTGVTGNERTLAYKSPYDAGLGNPFGTVRHVLTNSTDAQYFKLYSYTESDWIIIKIDSGSSLGGNQTNYAFGNIDLDITDLPDDSILHLAMVHWDASTEQLSDLRDLRRFVTFDGRDKFEEEHDEDGLHTKVLRNNLKIDVGIPNSLGIEVYAGTRAINAYARTAHAFYGYLGSVGSTCAFFSCPSTAVLGSATLNYGVVGSAASYGIYGLANANYGVVGSASNNFGVLGKANTNYGVWGEAPNYGVWGTVSSAYGLYGKAGSSYGVYGFAPKWGVYGAGVSSAVVGSAANGTGVYGIATTYGVYGSAVSAGVIGTADTDGVGGVALNSGVHGIAVSSYGVYGQALLDIGVCGSAPSLGVLGLGKTAVFGNASGSLNTSPGIIGVFGSATNSGSAKYAYGIYGIVSNDSPGAGVYGVNIGNGYGIYGSASSYGVYGSGGLGECGVAGLATNGIGVYGSGSVGIDGRGNGYGVFGRGVDSRLGANVYGVCGSAFNSGDAWSCIGVQGLALSGTGVYGSADPLAGIGGQFNGLTALTVSGGLGAAIYGSLQLQGPSNAVVAYSQSLTTPITTGPGLQLPRSAIPISTGAGTFFLWLYS